MESRSEGELQAASCSNNELIAMEDLTKAAAFLGAVFSPVMEWFVLKKDSELPWVIRIARWAGLIFGSAWCGMELIEKAQGLF